MRVTVKTVCRLHFGFLDLKGDLGRSYGSIGVALENPRTVVAATKAERLIVETKEKKQISALVRRFSSYYQVQPTVRIQLLESIPEHSGLGSGTQLALAVTTALAKICCMDAEVRRLSDIMGRGKRSGVGIGGFEAGGFIIDAGRKSTPAGSSDTAPKVVFRHDFPPDWQFVIVIPQTQKGLSGGAEDKAMNGLNPSRKISEEICRLTQIQLLPSLIEKDIEEFGAALTEIDLRTGMFFKEVQGGIYRGELARNLINFMLRSGAHGAGQSSWGPAIYGLVHETSAHELAQKMKDFLFRNNVRGQVFVSRCNNKGAETIVKESGFEVIANREAL